MLTPYQLAFTARISVLLLPWAALPWLVGLTMRADAHAVAGGLRRSLALVLLARRRHQRLVAAARRASGPLLWVVARARVAAGRRAPAPARPRRASACSPSACRCGGSWACGSRARYGLPVLQLTENVRTVAEASTPGDVLRGLGNWFFYGRDRTGYSIDQAADYAANDLVVVPSATPCRWWR